MNSNRTICQWLCSCSERTMSPNKRKDLTQPFPAGTGVAGLLMCYRFLTSWTHNSGVSDAATFHTTLQRFTPTLLGVVEVPSLHVLRSVTVTHHPYNIHMSQLSDNAYKSGTEQCRNVTTSIHFFVFCTNARSHLNGLIVLETMILRCLHSSYYHSPWYRVISTTQHVPVGIRGGE